MRCRRGGCLEGWVWRFEWGRPVRLEVGGVGFRDFRSSWLVWSAIYGIVRALFLLFCAHGRIEWVFLGIRKFGMTVGWMRFCFLATEASDLVLGSSCLQRPFVSRRMVSFLHADAPHSSPSGHYSSSSSSSSSRRGNLFLHLKQVPGKLLEHIYYHWSFLLFHS